MADDHQFLHSLKQSFSLSDIDQSFSHFPWPNPGHDQGLNSHDNFFPQLLECPGNIESIFPGLFVHGDENNSVLSKPAAAQPVISNDNDRNDKKRKGVEISTTESSSCSPQVSDVGTGKANCSRRGKKVKGNIKGDGKPEEVVHVRAKRGQATDSHSLAERVRRGKINERFRCLQDIVPGCYKAMGMAGMLDQIINYVQSLQNQVEFLSMKLTAASEFYDFNSDTDAMETIQGAKGFEALMIQNVAIQGQPSAQFGSLDNNFGYYPQLPHNNRS